MAGLKYIKTLDQNFSWSFFGFLFGMLFGFIGIYTAFFQDHSPDLNLLVTANTRTLEIKESVGKLDILYSGESLKSQNLELSVLEFLVVNQGNREILGNHYDPSHPVGFRVTDGSIADTPKIVASSNEYLRESLKLNRISENEYSFSNVILETEENFKVKLLILHDAQNKPSIEGFGKIAGVDKIDVISDIASGDSRSFFNRVVSGGWLVNIVRILASVVLLILLLALLLAFLNLMEAFEIKNERKNTLRVFRQYLGNSSSEDDEFMFDKYNKNGADIIKHLYEVMNNDTILQENYLRYVEKPEEAERIIYPYNSVKEFDQLIKNGWVVVSNNNASVNGNKLSVLREFHNYLVRQKQIVIREQSLEEIDSQLDYHRHALLELDKQRERRGDQ